MPAFLEGLNPRLLTRALRQGSFTSLDLIIPLAIVTRQMNRQQLLDLYFLEARARLIDLGAFLDRVERAEGVADFRLSALFQAIDELHRSDSNRAESILLRLSDPTSDPIAAATTKAACGAWKQE